ncbi:MAG: protoporphyrinogen oxidase [Actinomycetota bacterium]
MTLLLNVDVAVVGGGITGLTAAYTLRTRYPAKSVALLEASDRLGGKLHTLSFDGITIEAGADSFLAREQHVVDLCSELGIADELRAPAVFGALVWTGEGPRRLPLGTVMGVPASLGAALRAQPLSARGRLRALADLVLPGPLSGPDVAVAPFIRRRFGREVLERMVDPILAGTRAGDPEELSLAACLPPIDGAARSHRRVMAGLRGAAGPPPFLAPERGMSRLVDALAGALSGAEVLTGARVAALRAGGARPYLLELSDGAVEAGAVVLAVPAPEAASLLEASAPAATGELREVAHASVAAVTLVYPAGALDLPAGTSGFLVPSSAGHLLAAGTWWTLKWPGRGPTDRFVVRCFIGRAGEERALDDDDDVLIRAAGRDLARFIGTRASPASGMVVRWPDGLPQYNVGHDERIERIAAALRPHPGIAIAGADYRGTGIPDCIRQGADAAVAVAGATVESWGDEREDRR